MQPCVFFVIYLIPLVYQGQATHSVVIKPQHHHLWLICGRVFTAFNNTTLPVLRTHRAGGKVEMSDLTWEEKEQVLRLLFAKMNGQRQR